MGRKQCWYNRRRLASFVLTALLLIVTAGPAQAWNDQGRLDDQPVRCWRVLSADQMLESDDCFGPGDRSRFAVIMMRAPVPAPLAGSTVIGEPDHRPGEILVESPWSR
jgi:hypothetical protein